MNWVFSEADVSGSSKVFFVFRVEDSRKMKAVNLVINYVPTQEEILWGAVEIVVTHEVPAIDFFNRVYAELIKAGFEVAVDQSGIYVVKKLGKNILRDSLVKTVEDVCRILKDKCGAVVFVRAVSRE